MYIWRQDDVGDDAIALNLLSLALAAGEKVGFRSAANSLIAVALRLIRNETLKVNELPFSVMYNLVPVKK